MSNISGRFKVESYDKGGYFYHCRDEDGEVVRIDLQVSGDLPLDMEVDGLVGKTVTIEIASPYCYVSQGVKVVDEEVNNG